MELFAQAVKQGLTFKTERGNLNPQDVWQLPLTGNNGFNLDTLSRQVLKKVRAVEEESLVTEVKVSTEDELRLEILKFIIDDKQAEKEAAKNASETKAKRAQLQDLIAKKQNQAQEEKSLEELQAELQATYK